MEVVTCRNSNLLGCRIKDIQVFGALAFCTTMLEGAGEDDIADADDTMQDWSMACSHTEKWK